MTKNTCIQTCPPSADGWLTWGCNTHFLHLTTTCEKLVRLQTLVDLRVVHLVVGVG